ncbi:hypothetical protein J437_LFUL016864 [Ladona fulva]|uniref:Endocuticle structural glycoprotein n=1 Tax=Ladona fulva TaxID=123851 RepID=A0A8K0KL05_LADFU|nr:hypothetical protein J437_LFUL016864 [Ladona fulva]
MYDSLVPWIRSPWDQLSTKCPLEFPTYISGDGTVAAELGRLKPNADGSDYVLVKEGTVSYISPEGKTINLSYVADEYGFRATGDHLPTPPEA